MDTDRHKAAELEASIRMLEREFEARKAISRSGQRPLPPSVARAFQLAIDQRRAELMRLMSGP
jgi:hypothetical protein